MPELVQTGTKLFVAVTRGEGGVGDDTGLKAKQDRQCAFSHSDIASAYWLGQRAARYSIKAG